MLNKLIKYDLKYNNKVLVIFYILSIFFAILTRIFLNVENSTIMNIIGKICSGVTISMIFNILINNLMRLWLRFKNNLYNDESYLTHTLPIDKKTIYLSKSLSSLISIIISVTFIALSLFIAYYSKENLEILKKFLLPLATIYNSTIIKIVLAFLFVFFLEFCNGLQAGYTGIILGHRKNNAKTGYSVLFGIITYMIIQILGVITLFIIGLFNPDIMNLFITNDMISVEIIKSVICGAIIQYSLILIINYIINLKLFQKGVNID